MRSGVLSAQQWLLLGIVRCGAHAGNLALAAGVTDVVVETLRNENEIGEAEVDCEGSNGGHKTGEEGAGKVGHVAEEPDAEEE
jgi:hypothetical protein